MEVEKSNRGGHPLDPEMHPRFPEDPAMGVLLIPWTRVDYVDH